MSELLTDSPIAEQMICVDCGFCCDGTLFSHAHLMPGEKGNLPEKIEEKYEKIGDNEIFLLPCSYFEGKCTIYNQKRAHICSAFRCQLLNRLSDGTLSQSQAASIVANAFELRNEIYALFANIFGHEYGKDFRSMLGELGEIAVESKEKVTSMKDLEKLKLKCNLFEILLIKNFKSYKDFESMANTVQS